VATRITSSAVEEAAHQQLKEQVLQWKAGMEEGNRFTLEEARRRTPAERFRNHQKFLEGLASLELFRNRELDRRHFIPYHVIQEQWFARHTKRLGGN
jgi:hypothetical protein